MLDHLDTLAHLEHLRMPTPPPPPKPISLTYEGGDSWRITFDKPLQNVALDADRFGFRTEFGPQTPLDHEVDDADAKVVAFIVQNTPSGQYDAVATYDGAGALKGENGRPVAAFQFSQPQAIQ